MQHVVIIGNGISGITAARHIRKLTEFRITVISDECDFFFSRTSLMYIYMGHLSLQDTEPYERNFWKKNRIDLIKATVQMVNTTDRNVLLSSGQLVDYNYLIIATGSKSRRGSWPGQELNGVQSLYHYQDLLKLEKNTHPWNADQKSRRVQRAVITGGGLIGVELAEMLMSRNIGVTYLVREDRFWGGVLPEQEGLLITRHLAKHGVDVRVSTELQEITGTTDGRVTSVKTNRGETIPCEFVGITIGVEPNITFLSASGIDIGKGVRVDEYLRTNVPDVYAIGDCAEVMRPREGRRSVEAVWYTGRMMGETVARNIAGLPTTYEPGIWFNSAKFFDIEYQIYGHVPSRIPELSGSLYWEDHSGELAIRIVYDKSTKAVTGIHAFGLRLRQEVCENWIRSGTPIDKMMGELYEANFNPEFYRNFEVEIRNTFIIGEAGA